MEYYDGQILKNAQEHKDFANWTNSHGNKFSDTANGDGTYTVHKQPEPSEEETKQRRIAELKAELSSTDYKIIKCSECSLAGVDLPYDIAGLHAQRQALRDEINELEE